MADPISLVYGILTVISITKDTLALIQKIRHLEPRKIDELYYRMISEMKKTEGWVNHMRNSGVDNLVYEEQKDIRLLLYKLREYYSTAEEMYRRIADAKENNTPRSLAARTKIVLNDVTGELKGVLDTVAAMNSALQAIVSQLPSYYAANDDMRARVSLGASLPTIVQSLADSHPAQREFNIGPPPEISVAWSRSSTLRGGLSTTEELDPSGHLLPRESQEKQVEESQNEVIKILYKSALRAMEGLALIQEYQTLSLTAQRLRIWGCGIFNDPYPLDKVLASNVADYGLLREHLIGACIQLLLLQEQEYNALASNAENSQANKFQMIREGITVVLGADEIVSTTLSYWKELFEDEYEGEDEEQRAANRQAKSIWAFSKIVEIMFDLLPGIMGARHICCLRTEASQKANTLAKGKQRALEPAEALFEKECEGLKEDLQKIDNESKKQGKRVKLYAPIFQKEIERRKELYDSFSKTDAGQKREKEVAKQKQQELAEQIANFRQSFKPKKAKEQMILSVPSKPSEKQASDVKVIADNNDSAEGLEDFLEYFRNNTTSLWHIPTALSV